MNEVQPVGHCFNTFPFLFGAGMSKLGSMPAGGGGGGAAPAAGGAAAPAKEEAKEEKKEEPEEESDDDMGFGLFD